MVIDNLSNATIYFSLHPLFKKAFDFIKENKDNYVITKQVN